jgi:EAL domain-containing protein (putative c-di-GMP-specific phosphodiesterase class I)
MLGHLAIVGLGSAAPRFAAFAKGQFESLRVFEDLATWRAAAWPTDVTFLSAEIASLGLTDSDRAHLGAILAVATETTYQTDELDTGLEVVDARASATEFAWRYRRSLSRPKRRAAPAADTLPSLSPAESLLDGFATSDQDSTQVCMIVVAIDHLASVNFLYGRAVGDHMIRAIAEQIKALAHPADRIMRLDGTRFVMLTTQHNPAPLERWRGPLTSAFEEVAVGGEAKLALCAQMVSADREAIMAALRHISWALPAPSARQDRGLAEGEISTVLRREMALHYQRQYSVIDTRVTGLEALVRWQRPGHGLLMPHSFLPLIESAGAMTELMQFVIARAAQELHRQLTTGLVPRLAINFSTSQLADGTTATSLLQAASDAGLPLACLDIEVPPTDDLTQKARRELDALAAAGPALTLELPRNDWASARHAFALPFTRLKMDAGTLDQAAAREILSEAASRGLTLCISGIETAELYAAALTAGCDEVQGHYFSAPEPARTLATAA